MERFSAGEIQAVNGALSEKKSYNTTANLFFERRVDPMRQFLNARLAANGPLDRFTRPKRNDERKVCTKARSAVNGMVCEAETNSAKRRDLL